MNYQQTHDYLYSKLPIYQRKGVAAYKADIGNIIKAVEALKNPHLKFKSIHIAGTNGKGSTAHLLASVMQEAGYKVGLYTSPHLKDFRAPDFYMVFVILKNPGKNLGWLLLFSKKFRLRRAFISLFFSKHQI